MARYKDFRTLVETRYAWVNSNSGGPWVKLEEIMRIDNTYDKKVQDVMLAFGISYRQGRRWTQQYDEVAKV